MKLTGPFSQIISLRDLPLKGALKDEQLFVIQNGGIVTENGKIIKTDNFESLLDEYPQVETEPIEGNNVLLPAFIDSHTHVCFGGSRAGDFAMRLNGKTYLEIAESGGGIWSTVKNTRKLTEEELFHSAKERVEKMIQNGITTIEIKSGYGLSVEEELKMLRAIQRLKAVSRAEIISTFLGAHMKPKDFEGSNAAYLELLVNEVFPVLRAEKLTNRIDIFTEKSAFSIQESRVYLQKAREQGFEITVRADQFTPGASVMAVELGAVSADHLEFSDENDIKALSEGDTVATVLPGASIGLGMQFAPARKLLDAGVCLAIASDWNPGSAPMGDLLTQAAVLATFQKLSIAEVLSALTFRAAKALGLTDRGTLENGKTADFISFPTADFREIIYQQGQLKPNAVWRKGERIV